MNSTSTPVDLIVVGAGLAGLLTAWFRLAEHPQERVLVLEAASQAAGDHTWSFNLSDIDPALLLRIESMIVRQWPAYDVHFPGFSRQLPVGYATSTSASLLQALQPFIDSGQLLIRTRTAVALAGRTQVVLDTGEQVEGRAVIDARGGHPGAAMQLAYQKFLGLQIRTSRPHGLERPILMDATVPQTDRYRFFYCVPFSDHELLIEDTYYSASATLNTQECQASVCNYALSKGWVVQKILRMEQGVLPITLTHDFNRSLREETGGAPKIGLAGGLFHPTTGYSLPDAVRLAARIAKIERLSAEALARAVVAYKRVHTHRGGFFRRLNRMLFSAAEPEQGYKVLRRFYRMPPDLIQRFYAGTLTPLDKTRILCGWPPVPILAALGVMNEGRYRRHFAAAT